MKEDKNITDNLQLLDTILEYLINCEDYKKSYILLVDDFFNTNLKEEKNSYLHSLNFEKLFDTLFLREDRNAKRIEKLKEALCYLEEEKLIKLLPINSVRLTFKGIIKCSKPFVTEYKQNENKRLFDKYSSMIMFLISLVTFLIGLKLEDIILKYFH